MRFSLRPKPVKRARPLLGTIVAIRASGLADADAHRAIDCGFTEIAEIHSLMSFHEEDSDISRLNRMGADGPVKVSPHTVTVLRQSIELADATAGLFDITIAGKLVAWGFLPRPARAPIPDETATWRDIELIGPDRVRFHKPLWVDLGGIAKGYAVDCAIARMTAEAQAQYTVNAGGDIRVCGPAAERILLDIPAGKDGNIPAFDIENGSIASSTSRDSAKRLDGRMVRPHLDGVRRRAVGAHKFVSVLAEQCMIADALTKIVLARGVRSAPLLKKFGAIAYLSGQKGGGYILGTANPFSGEG